MNTLRSHKLLILTLYIDRPGRKIEAGLLKEYKTINKSRLNFYTGKEKSKSLSSAFRSLRKDIFFKKVVIK